jgi:hypothetical protein
LPLPHLPPQPLVLTPLPPPVPLSFLLRAPALKPTRYHKFLLSFLLRAPAKGAKPPYLNRHAIANA